MYAFERAARCNPVSGDRLLDRQAVRAAGIHVFGIAGAVALCVWTTRPAPRRGRMRARKRGIKKSVKKTWFSGRGARVALSANQRRMARSFAVRAAAG